MNRLSHALALLPALLVATAAARANPILLDIGPSTSETARSASSGIGQGIQVATTTTLSQIAIDANMPTGGLLDFFIFNATNNSLLFSQTDTLAASSSLGWVTSNPFSFTLSAGSTYYIGATANGSVDFGYLTTGTYSSSGLTAISDANTNYSGFATPTFQSGSPGSADVAMVLYGTSSSAPTPEPGTLALLGTGLVALPFLLTIAPNLFSRRRVEP